MRLSAALPLLSAWLISIPAITAQEPRSGPPNSYTIFAEYSNDSSRILIGESENRKLFAVGADFNRRLVRRRVFEWRYQVEIIPLMLLRNPLLTTDITVAAISGVYPISAEGIPPGTYHFSDLQAKQCSNASGTGYEFGTATPDGPEVPVWTYTFSGVCSNPWTYGGGVSPLGQKVNFLPRSRLQPFFAANAGLAAFSKVVPSDDATKFNFTFEFGGGLEWEAKPRQSWALDLRYHHISNAGRGLQNPGVDNATLKLSYTFAR